MAFKFVAVLAFVAVASGASYGGNSGYSGANQAGGYSSGQHAGAYNGGHYDAPAEYEFNYSVHDEYTGDIKSQQETRKGDYVQGQYSLVEPDGHRRIVDYTADEHTGFNAVVHREDAGYKAQNYAAAPVQAAYRPAVQAAYRPAAQSYHQAPAAAAYHSSSSSSHGAYNQAPSHQYQSAPLAASHGAYNQAPSHQYQSAPLASSHGAYNQAPSHQYQSAPVAAYNKHY